MARKNQQSSAHQTGWPTGLKFGPIALRYVRDPSFNEQLRIKSKMTFEFWYFNDLEIESAGRQVLSPRQKYIRTSSSDCCTVEVALFLFLITTQMYLQREQQCFCNDHERSNKQHSRRYFSWMKCLNRHDTLSPLVTPLVTKGYCSWSSLDCVNLHL